MDAILKIASDAGMTQQQGEAATGGIFALVKKNLESGQYDQILAKIPEIESLVNKQEAAASDRASGTGGGGGIATSLAALADAATGSGSSSEGSAGGIASLLAMLGEQGINTKQINAFLPQVTTLVQKQCGIDIGSILGVSSSSSSSSSTGTAAEGSETGGITGTGGSSSISGALNSAMGMFGK